MVYIFRKFIWSLFVLAGLNLSSKSLYAQQKAQTIEDENLRVGFTRYTQEDGLPHWDINGVFVDSKNLLWVKSGNYVTTYDGSRFTIIDTLDEADTFHPVMFAEDDQGNIWYKSTREKALHIYSRAKRRVLSPKEQNGNKPLFVNSKYRLHGIGGKIYLISQDEGRIWQYDGDWRLYYERDLLHHSTDAVLLPGLDSLTYVIQPEYVLVVNRNHKIVAEFSLDEHQLLGYSNNALFALKTNTPSLALENTPLVPLGVNMQLAKNPKWLNEPRLNSIIQTPSQDANASVFCSTTRNLGIPVLHYQAEGKHYTKNLVKIIDSLYVGAGKHLHSSYKYLITEGISQLSAVANGNILFLSNRKNGLVKVQISDNHFRTNAERYSFRAMKWLADSLLVMTQADGDKSFVVYNRRTGRIYSTPTLNTNVAQSTDSILTIDDLHMGITHYQSLTTGQYGKNTPFQNLTYIFKDLNGRKWYATKTGLYLTDSAKYYLPSLHNKALRVEHVYCASDSIFWLATNQGLLRWRIFTNKIKIYGLDDGLLNNRVHAVYPDNQNRLWLSTDYGISCFNITRQTIVNYTEEDGLTNAEQNFMAHSKGPDGNLYFGGIEGFVSFNPNEIFSDEIRLPQLNLYKLKDLSARSIKTHKLSSDITPSEPIRIGSNSVQQTLFFSFPFFESNKLRVKWRIPELDSAWNDANLSDGTLVFSLPHGFSHIEFNVSKARQPAVFQIHKVPIYKSYPFYMRWWFWLSGLIFIVFAIYLTLQWRTARLNKQNIWLRREVAKKTASLAVQNEKLVNQKNTLELIDTTRNELFKNINHEFRTPLSIIKVQSELLEEKLSSKNIKVGTRIINEQVATLIKMLDEVMDISGHELGKIELTKAPIALNSFLNHVYALFEGLAQKKQLNYRIDLKTQNGLTLLLDRRKLEGVLTNLIGNAIKFTPQVGYVHISSQYEYGKLKVAVADNGSGISEKERGAIFKRYQQGSAAAKSEKPGFGIGLALSQDYVNQMSGKLWVESKENIGSTFFVEIPAEEVQKMTTSTSQNVEISNSHSQDEHHAISKLSDENLHILLVEDNEIMLNNLKDAIQDTCKVTTCANGEIAWSRIQEDESIDLIISDIMMPLMDGFDLLKMVKGDSKLQHKPFVILTALSSEDDKLRGLRLGVDAYLTKPFSIKELRTQIANLAHQITQRKAYINQTEEITQVNTTAEYKSPKLYEQEWLEKLEKITLENLKSSNLKIPDIAIIMGVSERTLFDSIKRLTGLSPSEYLKKARLREAMKLIKVHKYKTVKEVANAVGMSDTRHFSKIFKAEYGYSPAYYM